MRSIDASERSIYPPREDTFLLAPFAEGCGGMTVLEIGTGNGTIAESAAKAGARVVATDLNPRALERLRARTLRSKYSLSVVRTDLAAGLRTFQRILSNPPYLPTPPGARDPDPWANLALDGGPDGCSVMARLVATLPEHLEPGGVAFLLESSRQSPARRADLRAGWTALGGTVRPVAERALEDEVLSVSAWTAPVRSVRADGAT
jgi:HemK-related putative methylase